MTADDGQNQDDPEIPFWRRKSLAQMTDSEWESLCDGCGKCCLNKLEEEETDRTYYTDVGCRLLDGETCRCRDYENRQEQVSDCVRLTPRNLKTITWLPPSCGYVLVSQGRALYWWHPLISGDPEALRAVLSTLTARDVFHRLPLATDRPSAIICHTVKGKGIAFAENDANWHHKSKIANDVVAKLYAALE